MKKSNVCYRCYHYKKVWSTDTTQKNGCLADFCDARKIELTQDMIDDSDLCVHKVSLKYNKIDSYGR